MNIFLKKNVIKKNIVLFERYKKKKKKEYILSVLFHVDQ